MKKRSCPCPESKPSKNPKSAKLLGDEESPAYTPSCSTARSSQSESLDGVIKNGVYFVRIDGVLNCNRQDSNNAFSLFELVNEISPIASIHFNYCVDVDFVLSQYPRRCRSMPITLVVGQGHEKELKREASDYKNITIGSATIPFPYCTHHSKLSLFESENAIHVMISTANLTAEDYGLKTQASYYFLLAFYYCRASFVASEEVPQSKFGMELLDYLRRAYSKGSPSHDLVSYWVDRMKQADFSDVVDRIVSTVPGRYQTSNLHRFGHMKLRSLLFEKFELDELDNQKLQIGQFSSIGSLGAMPNSWLCDEWLSSMRGKKCMVNPSSLKLIYPTVENVRWSLEGWAAGGSLPYSSTNHEKQKYLLRLLIFLRTKVLRTKPKVRIIAKVNFLRYLRNFLHKWKCDKLKRTMAMPHIKSYAALDDNNQAQWLLITSANLSKSAWGTLEKNQTQLFCRSYELGVLICLKDHPEMENTGLPVPFDLPLSKYAESDQPYLCDVLHEGIDAFGRKMC